MVRLGWTHICVDEFQDTNRAQYDLVRLIAPGPRHNLFVLADDDQIIYQWNGASPRRFDDLRRDYELETIQLPESYRCPPEIVDRANRLIRHNTRLVTSRKTVAVREARGAYADIIRQAVVGRQIEEAEFVGRDIRERGLPPGDCVVLGRTNRLVQFAAEGLQRAGLEAFVPQRKTEFDSPVPSVLAEALRLANSRHDRVVLRRICRQWERMTGVAIEPHAVGAAAALAGGDFLRAWADAAGAEEGRAALQRIPADLVDGLNFPGIVDSFLEGGWRSWGDGRRSFWGRWGCEGRSGPRFYIPSALDHFRSGCSQCNENITLCHVWYTFILSKALLCVVPRPSSVASALSSRLASPGLAALDARANLSKDSRLTDEERRLAHLRLERELSRPPAPSCGRTAWPEPDPSVVGKATPEAPRRTCLQSAR